VLDNAYVFGKLKKKKEFIPLQAWTGRYNQGNLRPPEFLDSRYTKLVLLSAIGTGRLYPPPADISGIHFRQTLSRPMAQNPNGAIGNRTRDLSACGALLQSIAPPFTQTVG